MTETTAKRLEAITVVIPAFNLAEYLAEAVESVLSQSYRGEIAIVIVDDGSSDGTWRVAQELASRSNRIRCYTQPNRGRVATRNRLLQLAETEWVGWLDGDDIAARTWIEDQASYLSEHADVVAVSGQGYAMTARRRAIGPLEHPLESEAIDRSHLDGHASVFFQSCVLTRKSAVVEAGVYREKYPAGEDYDLWLRLAEHGKLANVDRCHLFYRVHPRSANWTVRREQHEQGRAIVQEARERRGLSPLKFEDEIPVSDQRDDWNRRIYWINIALRSGNPASALEMLRPAIPKHPASLLLWLFAIVAAVDWLLLVGNQTTELRPASSGNIGELPWFSLYRLSRFLYRLRRAYLERK